MNRCEYSITRPKSSPALAPDSRDIKTAKFSSGFSINGVSTFNYWSAKSCPVSSLTFVKVQHQNKKKKCANINCQASCCLPLVPSPHTQADPRVKQNFAQINLSFFYLTLKLSHRCFAISHRALAHWKHQPPCTTYYYGRWCELRWYFMIARQWEEFFPASPAIKKRSTIKFPKLSAMAFGASLR